MPLDPELQLHHRKHVLHLRAHRRLAPVLRPLHFVNTILVAVAPMGAVLGLRRALPDHFGLSAISLIRPTPAFPRRAIDRAAPPNRLRWPPGTSGEWMLDQVRKHRLPIVGTGAAVWSFIHVDDVVTATLAAVEDGDPGIYNIVDD